MTEPGQAPKGTDQINNQADGGDNKGTDPTKTSKADDQTVSNPKTGEKAFDESVFEDPRLWDHPRFKKLSDQAKKARELEKQQAEAEEKRLTENKKFEELANKRAQERDELKNKFIQQISDNRIITEASKIGVVDVEAVLKLVDRSAISVDENGVVTGAAEAVAQLLATKPFLKGKSNVNIGAGTNPGSDNDTGAKKFRLSQLQDPTFYKKNEAEILQAYKTGNIEDDMSR